MRVIISSTGTGAGKTSLACALTRAWKMRGSTIALKPIETGVENGRPLDALALEAACGVSGIATRSEWLRYQEPLAPGSIVQSGGRDFSSEQLIGAVRSCVDEAEHTIVEGAGGLFVPLRQHYLFSDFARELGFPIVLVVPNQLGVLSHTYACVELAQRLGLLIAAVVLSDLSAIGDASSKSNLDVLRTMLAVPVFGFGWGGSVSEELNVILQGLDLQRVPRGTLCTPGAGDFAKDAQRHPLHSRRQREKP